MQNRLYLSIVLALSLSGLCVAQKKVVVTNDDGWAVAQVRAEYTALQSARYNVILSAPAINKSGSGSSTTTPTALTEPCQFNTCPVGSPAVGSNSSDARINYVNAYPVDAVRYGIQTLSPSIFGSAPDFVIAGSNIGNNLGAVVPYSGTVGAACEAALEGIPSIAFSGASGSQVSYTTLSTDPNSTSTKAANLYTALILKFTAQLLNNTGPILPPGITLNVNFASISSCPAVSNYKFVLTRVRTDTSQTDVTTCGTNHLTSESRAITQGCIATTSVMNATTKGDVDAATQAVALAKLQPILGCL